MISCPPNVLLYISLLEKSVSWMGFNLIIPPTYDTGLTDTGLAVQNNRLVLGAEWYWSLVKQLYGHWCWCNSIIDHEK